MKTLKRIVLGLLVLLVLLTGFILGSGRPYLFKVVWYNFAAIDDYKHFSNDTVAAAPVPQPWPVSARDNQVPYPDSLNREMEDLQSIGLLMIRDDSVTFEKYWDGYNDSSWSGSFSMAKSIVGLLIGAGLKEGWIGSLEDPVGKYLPEFDTGAKAKVRLIDLLTMSSGSDWDESYINPLSATAELYYASDIRKTATRVRIVRTPGTQHRYKSGDSQLLGLILEKATGRTLAELASEKLWKPLGAEHPALWSTDRPGGNEKAYCCFNSNTRDFARLGKLMLDSGKWNGTPIIDSAYWAASIRPCGIPDEAGQPCTYYGYQWWLDPLHPGVFYARGILGQYIIVIPSRKTVIVRLGKKRSPVILHTMPKEVSDPGRLGTPQLMAYTETIPAGGLCDYIDAYWDRRQNPGGRRVYADGCADLMVNTGTTALYFTPAAAPARLLALQPGELYLGGTMSAFGVVSSEAGSRMTGVRFRPGGFYACYGVSMETVVDQVISFADAGLCRLLQQAGDLDAYFLSKHFRPGGDFARICHKVYQSGGQLTVDGLSRDSFVSSRTLERIFKENVGIPPKEFIRIIRFQEVFKRLRQRQEVLHRPGRPPGTPEESLLRIAFELGYTDHAHLTNEFKRYAGILPSELSRFYKTGVSGGRYF